MAESLDTAAAPAARPRSALTHPGFRTFFICIAFAMTADFIEHVISYWVLWQKFHSTWLSSFAVFSHWVPFLLLSIVSGSLSERFDTRRIVQLGMLIFMSVSVAWAALFYSGKLQMWHACVLLVVHGLAGVLWNPATQMLLYDMVGPVQLPSAVRLTASARNLGMLVGPFIGSLMLFSVGPAWGIFINALIYLPMIVLMWKAPYGPKFRQGAPAPVRAIRSFADIADTLKAAASNRTLLSMVLLAAAASFFMGNAYQAQMPELAQDLLHGDPRFAYGVLVAADACGALIAALVLESSGLLSLTPRTTIVLAMVWCAALAGFALAKVYPLAVGLLLVAGFVELSFNSMAQTLVQLNAPAAIRGRIIGVFLMASLGMRTFSGLVLGSIAAFVGIHYSMAISVTVLFVAIAGLLVWATRRAPAPQ